jgi:hypothetical protein
LSRGSQASAQQIIAQAQAEGATIVAQAQKTMAELSAEVNSMPAGSTEQKEAASKLTEVWLQASSQIIALNQKAAEAAEQAAKKASAVFVKFFDTLGSGFESFSSSLIKALIAPQELLIKQGLTTRKFSEQGNEIRSAISSLLLKGINDAANSVESALMGMLAKALSGGASNTVGELLGNWLSKGLFSITGGALGSAATGAAPLVASATALTSAGTALGTAAVSLNTAAASLTASASTTGSAGAVGLGGLLGFARGGVVPSAAGGMVASGAGASLALLHPREMVLPAHISDGIQKMLGYNGGRGTNANLNYAPTINTASRSRSGTGMTRAEFAQMLSLHSGSMLGETRNMMRGGWRPA